MSESPKNQQTFTVAVVLVLVLAALFFLFRSDKADSPPPPSPPHVVMGGEITFEKTTLSAAQSGGFNAIVQGAPTRFLDEERSDPPLGFFRSGDWGFGLYPGIVVGYEGKNALRLPVWESNRFDKMIESFAADGYDLSPASIEKALRAFDAP